MFYCFLQSGIIILISMKENTFLVEHYLGFSSLFLTKTKVFVVINFNGRVSPCRYRQKQKSYRNFPQVSILAWKGQEVKIKKNFNFNEITESEKNISLKFSCK